MIPQSLVAAGWARIPDGNLPYSLKRQTMAKTLTEIKNNVTG
jgi:hypothetical protein